MKYNPNTHYIETLQISELLLGLLFLACKYMPVCLVWDMKMMYEIEPTFYLRLTTRPWLAVCV